jgi:hypothetical protein
MLCLAITMSTCCFDFCASSWVCLLSGSTKRIHPEECKARTRLHTRQLSAKKVHALLFHPSVSRMHLMHQIAFVCKPWATYTICHMLTQVCVLYLRTESTDLMDSKYWADVQQVLSWCIASTVLMYSKYRADVLQLQCWCTPSTELMCSDISTVLAIHQVSTCNTSARCLEHMISSVVAAHKVSTCGPSGQYFQYFRLQYISSYLQHIISAELLMCSKYRADVLTIHQVGTCNTSARCLEHIISSVVAAHKVSTSSASGQYLQYINSNLQHIISTGLVMCWKYRADVLQILSCCTASTELMYSKYRPGVWQVQCWCTPSNELMCSNYCADDVL